MNKILLIPDIHGRTFWKIAVDKYANECDKIVFIGDYVDPYGDEGITRKDAINILNDVIVFKRNNMDKVVLLFGNHDLHYIFQKFQKCSRYDSSHAYHIRGIYYSNLELFKLAHQEIINGKTYLFSHAGVMNSWLQRNESIIGEPTVENLNKLTESIEGINTLCDVSQYRSDFGEKSGSIVWSDVREKMDDPNDAEVEGYDYQIFGHTQLVKEPIVNDKWACVDCREAFIIDDDGTLKRCE